MVTLHNVFKGCPDRMHEKITATHLLLVGLSAVGGIMSGTCLAVRKTLRNGQARIALFLGYAFIGLTFGVLGAVASVLTPFYSIHNLHHAVMVGLIFGAIGVVFMASINFGSIVTLRYLGLRVTIEPDYPSHTRRQEDD